MKSCSFEHWSKVRVAYMGVDPDAFAPRPFRPTPAPFEMLCVGRLAPVKAQHILLQAVARIRSQGRDILLHLPGGGPDRATLESAATELGIRDNVKFHGWVTEEDLNRLYMRADAFVLASFAEGLPGVLLEAMAMEIPCVSTWITGVPELIRADIDGLLVPPADADALAAAVIRLIDEPELRLRLGKAGRARVIDKFHLTRNAEHLLKFFL
jgi:colanic acid/amylovoran biosynthesis glycosyltransferase